MKKRTMFKALALILALSLLASMALAAGTGDEHKLYNAFPKFVEGTGPCLDPNAKPVHQDVLTVDLTNNNSFMMYAFYTGADADLAIYDGLTSDDPTIVKVFPIMDFGRVLEGVFGVQGLKTGETTLRYEKNGAVWTQKVQVVLPEDTVYFRSAQSFEEENILSELRLPELPDCKAWVGSQLGFTQEQVQAVTVRTERGYVLPAEQIHPVRRTDGRYDLQLDLNGLLPPSIWDDLVVDFGQEEQARITVTSILNGENAAIGPYTVGFSFPLQEDSRDPFDILSPGMRIGMSTFEQESTEYQERCQLTVAAGIATEDENGFHYEQDKEGKVGIRVDKLWLDQFYGTPETFSLSGEETVHERSNPGERFSVYHRSDAECSALLKAEVTLTLEGETKQVVISQPFFMQFLLGAQLHRPDDDTVEQLNQDLQALELSTDPVRAVYEIELGNCAYNGTIVLPEKLRSEDMEIEIWIRGSWEGETILNGGLDLNGCTASMVGQITFHGTEQARKGVYGGCFLNMSHCAFDGYDRAVEMKEGSGSMPCGNLFYNNKTAIYVNLDSVHGGNKNPWESCTFYHNDTAIEVEDLSDWMTPYFFRILNCNFVDNKVDFDVDEEGNFYFYRNYYGTLEHDQLTRALPKLQKHQKGFVMTNPRWEHPVYEMQHELVQSERPEQEPENKLVSDWETDTVILNDEAQNLKLDQSAFDEAGQKQVEVYNQDEQPVGTWNIQ